MTDHGGDPSAVAERAHELIVEMITLCLAAENVKTMRCERLEAIKMPNRRRPSGFRVSAREPSKTSPSPRCPLRGRVGCATGLAEYRPQVPFERCIAFKCKRCGQKVGEVGAARTPGQPDSAAVFLHMRRRRLWEFAFHED